jgi:predicted nucleotidyltransferase
MTDNTIMNETLLAVVRDQPHAALFVTISGAHLYGFPSPDSDYDLRGAHMLPLRDVIGLVHGQETIDRSEMRNGVQIDLVTHDVKKFFSLLMHKNGYVLEQLYSPLVVSSAPEHDELKTIAANCITKHHSHHYLGFSKSQWKLFTKEHPRRIKPLLYVFRVLLTGIHLMRTGQVEANLLRLNEEFNLPYIPDLVTRKSTGTEQRTLDESDLAFYTAEYERLRAKLETAHETSSLPDSPTCRDALHDLLVRLRLAQH